MDRAYADEGEQEENHDADGLLMRDTVSCER